MYRFPARPVTVLAALLTAGILLMMATAILSLQAWQNPQRLAREFVAHLNEGSSRAWYYLTVEAREKVSWFDAPAVHRLIDAFQSGAFEEPQAKDGFFSRTVDVTVVQESGTVPLRLYFTRTLAGWRIAYIKAVGG